jgi:hypothetical protein
MRINLESILEIAEECQSLKPMGVDDDPNGFDSAILGITDDGVIVYSKELMVDIVRKVDGVTDEDAWEYLEYNTFCAYVGDLSPIYVNQFI